MTNKHILLLFGICIIAFILRTFSIHWDQGFSLHPDERAIVMFVGNISFPTSVSQFFSADSPLNPDFFAYGSLPLYLLKILGEIAKTIDLDWSSFANQLIVGRFISATADIGTLIFIFLIGRLIHSKSVGFLSAAIYGISVFPIQASHFYAVDILLTFFMTAAFYFGVRFYLTKKMRYLVFTAISFGLALSTKISAFPIILPILILLSLGSASSLKIKELKKVFTLQHVISLGLQLVVLTVVTVITAFICQPYVFIDFQSFIRDTTLQSEMTKSAFTFPYTLQYVGKLPYIYELENIFFWGLGPVQSILSACGLGVAVRLVINRKNKPVSIVLVSLLIFCLTYFALVGGFAVGWMRYMLPLYPYFALFTSLSILIVGIKVLKKLRYLSIKIPILILTILAILIWPMSFMKIYTQTHPRINASEWIHKNVPSGSTLGVEHWDDHLPLYGGERYVHIEYPLYDHDTPEKWLLMEEKLQNTDYIVLASNRLYIPLQKLTNCEELPEGRCYKQTAAYYQLLFSGELGFTKVAEFTNYPTIPLTNIQINDQSADESFSVYDHPKVLIFKKQ